MSTSTSTIRTAIQAEIKTLTNELGKLQKLLSQLGDGESAPVGRPPASASLSASTGGKRKYTKRQKASETDVEDAVKLIEKAGKGGIKAIKLAYELKKTGGAKVAKNDLLATDKVKMTGTGGGSTYIYIG